MQKEKQLVPKLRFPEFEEEWNKYKIGDSLVFKNGKGHEQNIDKDGQYIVVNSKFVSTNGQVKKFTNEIICPLYKDENVMVMSDVPNGKALAKCFYIDENQKYSLNQRICSLYSKKHNNKFLFYRINRHKYFLKLDTGYTQTNLRKDEILNAPLIIPKVTEQQKIADFLSAVDTRIQNLEKKKELLEQYKKGITQKIFKQEIRFKPAQSGAEGDDDGKAFPEWKKKKLGAYLLEHKEKTTYSDQYPVLTSSRQGIMFQTEYYSGNQVASKDNTGYNVVPRNYFTYRHMSDDLVFKFNRNTICDKGIVSTLYPVFRSKDIDDNFLELKLNEGDEIKRYALLQKQGGSRTYLYFKKLSNMKMYIPCLEEQTKIANFLSAIDERINLVTQQITQTKAYKKGLLQQMFV